MVGESINCGGEINNCKADIDIIMHRNLFDFLMICLQQENDLKIKGLTKVVSAGKNLQMTGSLLRLKTAVSDNDISSNIHTEQDT